MGDTQNILDALYTKLIADQSSGTLYDLLGGRIYGMFAPQDEAMPLLVFNITDDPKGKFFGNKTSEDLAIDFDIYGDAEIGPAASGGVGEIENSLFDLLEGFELSASGYDRGVVLFQSRNVRILEEKAVRVTSRAIIRAVTS